MVTKRTPTLICLFDTIVVKLSRADYLRICGSLEESVVKILQKPPDDRLEMDLQLVHGLFHEAQLFKILYYDVLQKACSKVMNLVNFAKGKQITKKVSFQWKNPDFLSKTPDFLIRNPDFLLKNVDFIIHKTGRLW